MIRNILDPLGNVIGTLQLPDNTREEVWTAALSIYSTIPSTKTVKLLDTQIVKATSQTTTSSGTPSTVEHMTQTPGAGTYLAFFNGSIYTDGVSAKGEFGIYINNVLVQDTRRDISCSLSLLGGLVSISLNSIGLGTYTGTQVVLTGNDIIDVKFKSSNGGTIGFLERSFILVKVQNG